MSTDHRAWTIPERRLAHPLRGRRPYLRHTIPAPSGSKRDTRTDRKGSALAPTLVNLTYDEYTQTRRCDLMEDMPKTDPDVPSMALGGTASGRMAVPGASQ
jgi:hypothetical protein